MSALDVTWVDADFAVGAAFPPAHVADLSASEIRRVVDLRAEECDDSAVLGAHRIELLHLPTRDSAPMAPLAVDLGVAWVCDALDRGLRVLVHCQRGIRRSAMLASCVLVARGLDLPGALRRIRQAGVRLAFSQDQLRAVMRWVEARARRRAEPIALRWSELVTIVGPLVP